MVIATTLHSVRSTRKPKPHNGKSYGLIAAVASDIAKRSPALGALVVPLR